MSDDVVRRMVAAQLVISCPPNPADLEFMLMRSSVVMLVEGRLSDRSRAGLMERLDAVAAGFSIGGGLCCASHSETCGRESKAAVCCPSCPQHPANR